MKSTIKQGKRSHQNPFALRRIISLFLLLVLITMCFSGCNDTVVISEGVTSEARYVVTNAVSQSINIGYYQEDSFNPYYMDSDLNTDLISLVFEPLFYVDDTFLAQPQLASSYLVEDTTMTVYLDTSSVFSDGVVISSADVVYSFNLAKNSDIYASELLNISTAEASGADAVIFTLSTANKYAADSLVFPIVKNSTADSSDSVPTGTGLYKYNVSGEEKTLEYNVYSSKPEPSIKEIVLISVSSVSTLIHTLELGTIDAYFDDLSSGSYSQANSSNTKTNLPNLVFIGMNSESYGLSTTSVRQAIFYAVNRTSIVKNSFKNYAVESYTPYHPEWHVFEDSGYDTSSFGLDYSSAGSLMTSAGFTENINLTMIVYTGNNFKVAAAKEIADSLENINITLTVEELTWDEYTQALSEGNYDLYLGEVKLSTDMNMSSLFGSGSILYGVNSDDTTANAYTEFANGNISINAFTDSFLQNMPIVPICFRMGSIVYSSSISPAADCDYLNVYKNIYEWTVTKTADEQSSEIS